MAARRTDAQILRTRRDATHVTAGEAVTGRRALASPGMASGARADRGAWLTLSRVKDWRSPGRRHRGMDRMKLKAGDLAVGTCYATRHGDLRQIVSLETKGEVTFDAHKKTDAGDWANPRRFHASVDAFLRELVAEVPCA